MGYWTVVVPAERYAQERLVGNVSLAAVPGPAPGDQVALVAGVEPPVVFGLGTVGRDGRVHYTRRLFDAPLPADDLATGPLPADVFLLGTPVKGGFYGGQPSLTDLDNGDLKVGMDFRDVYATLLRDVLDTDPGKVLPGWSTHLVGPL